MFCSLWRTVKQLVMAVAHGEVPKAVLFFSPKAFCSLAGSPKPYKRLLCFARGFCPFSTPSTLSRLKGACSLGYIPAQSCKLKLWATASQALRQPHALGFGSFRIQSLGPKALWGSGGEGGFRWFRVWIFCCEVCPVRGLSLRISNWKWF